MVFKKDKFDDIVETVPLLEVGDTAKVAIELEDKDEDDLFFEDKFNEVWCRASEKCLSTTASFFHFQLWL